MKEPSYAFTAQLIALLHHDLEKPFSALEMYLDVCKNSNLSQADDEKWKREIEKSLTQSRRLLSDLSTVFTAGKPDHGLHKLSDILLRVNGRFEKEIFDVPRSDRMELNGSGELLHVVFSWVIDAFSIPRSALPLPCKLGDFSAFENGERICKNVSSLRANVGRALIQEACNSLPTELHLNFHSMTSTLVLFRA